MDKKSDTETRSNTDRGREREGSELGEEILNEKYIIWRKNIPFMYSVLLKNKLEWPSMSVEFLGHEHPSKTKLNYYTNKLLLGTSTGSQELDYVYIGELKIPISSLKEDVLKYENYTGYISKNKKKKRVQTLPNFEIKAKLLHPGDVLRAAHLPSNPFFLATQTDKGNILLFDYSKHPSFPADTNIAYPQLILQGHTGEGTGLCWNVNRVYEHPTDKKNVKGIKSGGVKDSSDPNKEKQKPTQNNEHKKDKETEYEKESLQLNENDAFLASCSSDGSICIWDINQGTKSNHVPRAFGVSKIAKQNNFHTTIYEHTNTIGPLCTWKNLNNVALNDIFFHPKFSTVLGTCDENGYMHLYDTRKKHFFSKAEVSYKKHEAAMNTFSFDNVNEFIFISGYGDGIIALWDIRNNKESLLTLDYHTQSINRVRSSMISSGIFGSCSDDGTSCIWDISRDNNSYERICKKEDDNYNSTKEIPTQLLFVHGGHIGSVLDLSWSATNSFLVATVGIDNTLQVWNMNDHFVLR